MAWRVIVPIRDLCSSASSCNLDEVQEKHNGENTAAGDGDDSEDEERDDECEE
jgi:hypothetical protein